MSEETKEAPEREMTPAEMLEMRERMIKYYTEQNTVLTVQSDYEKHLADIEENRARRLTMTMRIAQMMAGPAKEKVQAETPAEVPSSERKLKKD